MSKKQILAVDHDPAMLTEIADLITKAGFEAVSISNAQTALDHLDKHGKGGLRMIVAEAIMPDVDGFGFLKEVKKRPAVKDLPFLFLTHAHDTSILINAFEQGAVDYFFKPIKKELFIAKIRSMVGAFDDHIRNTNTLLSGNLSLKALEEIIATCEHESLNGFIRIHHPDGVTGVITFLKGLPDGIYIENGQGKKIFTDTEAFEKMHEWTNGDFVVRRGTLADY
jgi:response regulator RpfG family c-di-GMP phosphodiesterase